jgi:hypothetical protein
MKHAVTILIALLAPLAALHAADASAKTLNILFLFADDQRADTIAALGNSIIKTPNIDRLVHSGMAFNRAYMQGGFNGATCVPSRAMLLSGEREMERSGDAGSLTVPNPKPAAWSPTDRVGKGR